MKIRSDVLDNGQSKGDLRTKLRSFRKSGRKGGFTLVELIVCIVIVLVLAGIATPFLMRYIEQSGEASDMASARTACVEVVTAAVSGDPDSPLHIGNGTYVKKFPLAQGNDGWATDISNAVVGGVSASDKTHWKSQPKAGRYCKVYFMNNELFINWGGEDYINTVSASDFLTKDILKTILSGSNYGKYLDSNDPTQNGAVQKFLDYAEELGLDLEKDYGAKTWQILPASKNNGEILTYPAIYWSSVELSAKNEGTYVPVMGYRNGRYDVWYAKVESSTANGTTYYRFNNGFATVDDTDNKYGNNMGGGATFQFESSQYETAKQKYDALLDAYNKNGTVTSTDISNQKL